MTENLETKTILITGGTNGIGLVAARELARMGAQTVIIGRNPEKCVQSVDAISRDAGSKKVEYIVADLSTKAGVRQAAQAFRQRFEHLDVLLNNAGAMFMSRQTSADGFEMTLALNHLAYFHLTHLLLDMLQASPKSRIVNVSSDAHRGARLDLDDLQITKNFSGFGAYSKSKLANLYFSFELGRRLSGTDISVNALHPGFVDTGFAKNNGILFKIGMLLMRPMQKSVSDGARTSIYLVSSPAVNGISGKYFADCLPAEPDPIANDTGIAARLWDLSMEMIS